MKQVVSLVLTLILAGVVSAGTVRITAEDAGGQMLRIGYEVTSGLELPIGFGLDILLDGPATFQGVVSASPYFPIYPGTVSIDFYTGVITDYGTPVAPAFCPDAFGGLGTSGATIEMGVEGNPLYLFGFDPRDFNGDYSIDNKDLAVFVNDWLEDAGGIVILSAPPLSPDLNGDGTVNLWDYSIFVAGRHDAPPAVVTELLLLQLDGNGAATTTVTIFENLTRGGIGGGGGMPFDVILPEPFTVVVPEPATLLLLGAGGLALLKKRRDKLLK